MQAPPQALTVIVSRGQSRSPDKRALESEIAEAAARMPGLRTLVVPHLYDLQPHSETIQQLRALEGDLLILSWVYPRAAHWVLDRAGVRGRVGEVLLVEASEDEDDEETPDDNPLTSEALEPERVADLFPRPERHIYCLDLRLESRPGAYLEEIARIAGIELPGSAPGELPSEVAAAGSPELADPSASGQSNNGHGSSGGNGSSSAGPMQLLGTASLQTIDEPVGRRWYPVIDFARCTNCMECIDFCLFGVYGVDDAETILVEQPDNCRKGCPACSRVCPQNAIIFPQHKTPAIAGAPVDDGGGFKIDLSQLFGAPETDEDPVAVAARERDEQLLLSGRAAVGMEVGIPKRHAEKRSGPKDNLDHLLDQLEDLDL